MRCRKMIDVTSVGTGPGLPVSFEQAPATIPVAKSPIFAAVLSFAIRRCPPGPRSQQGIGHGRERIRWPLRAIPLGRDRWVSTRASGRDEPFIMAIRRRLRNTVSQARSNTWLVYAGADTGART